MSVKQPWVRTEPASTGGVPQVVVLGWPDFERLADAVAASNPDPGPTDAPGPVTMSVDEAARYLGISRSHAYDLVRSGTIPTCASAVASSSPAATSMA